jgi:hypothetical protein
MKGINGIRKFGAVLAMAALFATSTFADDRPRNGSGDWRGNSRDGSRDGRNDGRYGRNDNRNHSAQGRITNLHRERDGYRVQLDRGSQWYYVPSSAWRSRGRNVDLRIGVSIRLGGGHYDDRGYIRCDDAWIDDGYYEDNRYGYSNRTLRGTVQRVDYRRGVLEVRDERSGRHVTVDLRQAERRNRSRRGIDVSDLRRGDYIAVEGEWVRGNVFEAYRIDGVDSRR